MQSLILLSFLVGAAFTAAIDDNDVSNTNQFKQFKVEKN